MQIFQQTAAQTEGKTPRGRAAQDENLRQKVGEFAWINSAAQGRKARSAPPAPIVCQSLCVGMGHSGLPFPFPREESGQGPCPVRGAGRLWATVEAGPS